MMILNLFSTSHCHLCEQAEMIIRNLPHQDYIKLNIIEITDDSIILDLYGSKIPVLHRFDTKAEINWPFNLEDIEKFIL